MIYLKFSPEWFYLPSLLIDFFSFIVLFFISYLSLKYYRLNKLNKKYYYLAFSFFLVCLSFLFKFLTNMTVFYDLIERNQPEIIGQVILQTGDALRSYDVFSNLTFAAFGFLHLLGLYYLYSVYQKNQSKSSMFLIGYFIIITTYFSHLNYYIFHITAFIFLSLITALYINRYKENGYENTRLLGISFGVIALSQILFIFTSLGTEFYIIGETIQLMGYLLLFLILKKVLHYGQKKKQN